MGGIKVLVKQHSADISHVRECCNHVEGLVSEELEEKVEAKTGHTHQPHQQKDDHPRYMEHIVRSSTHEHRPSWE